MYSKRLAAARELDLANKAQQLANKDQQLATMRRGAAALQQQLILGEANLKAEIVRLEQRLAALPDSVDQTAYISLFAVGSKIQIEVIRFTGRSRG